MKIILYCLLLFPIVGRTQSCSESDVRFFNDEIIKIRKDESKNWAGEIHRIYFNLIKKGCDDGFISEGISDIVVKKISKNWGDASRLMKDMKNEKYKLFILKHIDSTVDWDDLDKLTINARKKCPSNLIELCSQIAKASSAASLEAKRRKTNN